MQTSVQKCAYCKEAFKEAGRFTIFCNRQNETEPLRSQQDDDDSVLSFCLPECACAYNYYMSQDPDGDHCQKRHLLMEQVYGRRIKNAPPRNMLSTYIQEGTGISRRTWLKMCRNNLNAEDKKVAEEELTNISF